MSRIDNLVAGLAYIKSRQPKADFSFEHDQMYVGNREGFTSADSIVMEKLGFGFDETLESWYFFS